MQKKTARSRFLARLTEMCAKKSDRSLPVRRGRQARHLRADASAWCGSGRLFCVRTVSSGMSLEDEANLNAFGVPSNPLLVDAIPRQWQSNFRQQIGSKQRARANTDSPGLI